MFDFTAVESLHHFYKQDAYFTHYEGKNVLVTGAGGFIGSHLVEALVLAGAKVTALLKYNGRQDRGNLMYLSPNVLAKVTIVFGDITDGPHMLHLLRTQDLLFHLAALIGIPYSYVAPQHYVNTNIQGTLNILEAAKTHHVKLVHTSTSEAYGTATYTPIDEAHPLQGQSPYSASKIGADMLVESYARSFDMPIAVIRPFNTFGPRQSSRAFIPSVIQQLLQNDTVHVGSLLPHRDLSPVWDTVRGFLAVGASPEAEGEVINIGNGHTHSMGYVLDQLVELTHRQGIEIIANEVERVRPEKSEVLMLLAHTGKAKRLLGWEPKLTLEEGLATAVVFTKAHPQHVSVSSYAV
ncbi:MAG: SDR family NAD(P)-dependent oxidoreductase [Vampirovibrio sp.]